VKLFRNASIKHKQMFSMMLTTGMALLLGCAALATYEVITFRKTMLRMVTTMAEIIGDTSSAALHSNNPKGAEELLATLKAAPNIVGACVYRKDGRVFAKYDRPGDGVDFIPREFQASGHHFGRRLLTLHEPIAYQGDAIGAVYIAADMNALYGRLEQYGLIMASVFSVALLVALGLSAWLQRLVSEPILELVETARAVVRDRNYSLRAVKRSEDELGALFDGFNEILGQIQERDGRLQTAHDQLENRVRERTEELANSLSLVNATLESTKDGILVTSSDGQATNMNEKFVTMLRMPREVAEAKEKEKMLAVAMSQSKQPEEFLKKVMLLNDQPEMESFDLLEFKDGRIYERYSIPRRIGKTLVGRVWNFRDVTERQRAEQQLQASLKELSRKTALLEAIMNSSPDGMLVLNDENRRMAQNLQFNRLLNIPPDITEDINDARRFQYVTDSTQNPEQFQKRVFYLNQHRDETSRDEIEFKNGTVLDRYSSPVLDRQGNYYGRIWTFRDITGQKRMQRDVEASHRQLVDISRQAGMAEVASSVLHNVGNVLNSVNISSSMVAEKVRTSKAAGLAKVAAVLQANKNDFAVFFGPGGKGGQLPDYLSGLARRLMDEQEEIVAELASLNGNIEHIKEIVTMQQSYARVSGVVEEHNVVDLVEDALRMNTGAMDRHQVQVIREFSPAPRVLADKHKILQILVNLIRNAKYALDDGSPAEKKMILRVAANGDRQVKISVADNGVGIPAENLTRIFGHGFTTRKDGHGFGLHSGAMTAKELGGSLTAHSDGPGKGAAFTLEIPGAPAKEEATV
jgi:PAS domain S-box-containing protein